MSPTRYYMIDEIDPDVKEELDDLSDNELDFLEREVFLAYDDAYEAYHQHDMNTTADIAVYERALETIATIRRIKEKMDEDKFEKAKDIHNMLDE